MLLPLLVAASLAVHSDSSRLRPPAAPIALAGRPVSTPSLTGFGDGVTEAPTHPIDAPHVAGLGIVDLLRAEHTVMAEVQRGAFPGAALAVGRWNQTVVEDGIGHTDWGLGAPEVDPDRTMYDLASLTKVIATTTAVMLLVEDGKMRLDVPVSTYIPAFAGGRKDQVTVRMLLTHTSGLPAGVDLPSGSPDYALGRAIAVPLETAPGSRVEYSDIGFVVLFAAAQQAAGEPIPQLLERRVFGPLGMASTRYLPGGAPCGQCAPTAQRSDGTLYQGSVHDPIARALGGVAGNAGLFSTVHDLAEFAAMLAGGGAVNGVRVLRSETIREFTQRQPGAGTRALGWDTPERDGGGAAGLRISPRAFGHTGFTGTSLWVDPDRGTWTVLLSNRTYEPRASNRIQYLRRAVHDWVSAAADPQAAE
jgi:CubicO group peptidase (beta-lactamase class C family)